jgi:hypothetical protein
VRHVAAAQHQRGPDHAFVAYEAHGQRVARAALRHLGDEGARREPDAGRLLGFAVQHLARGELNQRAVLLDALALDARQSAQQRVFLIRRHDALLGHPAQVAIGRRVESCP